MQPFECNTDSCKNYKRCIESAGYNDDVVTQEGMFEPGWFDIYREAEMIIVECESYESKA